MKQAIAAVIVLASYAAGSPQGARPSVDKCRADASVWENSGITTPTLDDLSVRLREMSVCMDVDPFKSSPEHFRQYQEMNRNIEEEYARRMEHFIDRHGLRQQFMDEDANGKR